MVVECPVWLAITNLVLFFFQAEDGIRDTSVTGVQTCALPILANQIPTAHSLPALSRLLAERITPSLFIRQSALYLFVNDGLEQVYANGLSSEQTDRKSVV